jgi:two-component system sensor histidine kinase DesK
MTQQGRLMDEEGSAAAGAGNDPPGSSRLRFRLGSRVMAALFIAYPLIPILATPTDVVQVALAVTAVALFIGLFALNRLPPTDPRRSSLAALAANLVVTSIAVALTVRIPGAAWLAFFYYGSTSASGLLPRGRAAALIVTAGLAGAATISAVSSDPAGAIVQGLSIAAVGFVLYGAVEVRRTNAALVSAQQQLAALVVVEERNRIARDLHDTLGQSLSMITLKSELAGRLLPGDPEQARVEIHDVERAARQAMTAVRETVAGNRRPTIQSEIETARAALASRSIVLRTDVDVDTLSAEADAVIAWTIREGVTNVLRHSSATDVRITVTAEPGSVGLAIIDDGRNPSPAVVSSTSTGGTGLAGLAERIESFGGSFNAGPNPDGGFRLEVRVPTSEATP